MPAWVPKEPEVAEPKPMTSVLHRPLTVYAKASPDSSACGLCCSVSGMHAVAFRCRQVLYVKQCVGELEPRLLPRGMGVQADAAKLAGPSYSHPCLLWHNPTVKAPRSVRNQPIHQQSQRLVIKHGFTDQDARTSHQGV